MNVLQNLCFIVLLFLVIGCQKNAMDYQLVQDKFSVKVEKFDSTITDSNRFNHNNHIFKVGRSFIYDFTYINSEGEQKTFQISEDNRSWQFAVVKEGGIEQVEISVLSGLKPFTDWIPDYNQTILTYKMLPGDRPYNMSGVIENEANLWMHPPRGHLFKILELNPFPFIHHELADSSWSYAVGASAEQYADARWAEWQDVLRVDSKYEKIGTEKIDTAFGQIECIKIKGVSTSDLGETSLISWFHEDYGFLRLEYQNIDSSQIVLELSELREG